MDNTPSGLPDQGAEAFLFSRTSRSQGLLTKRQLNKRYPNRNYQIVGEYPPKHRVSRRDAPSPEHGDPPLCQYHSHSRLVYATKGFLPCGENSYGAVLRNRLPLRLSAAGLCALLMVLAAVWWSQNPVTPAGSGLGVDPNAADYSQSDGYNKGGSAGSSIEIPGYKSIPVAADSTQAAVDFRNPSENACYFVIRLTLEDGTELYRSQLIPPGKGIQNITLSNPLPQGEYAASIQYDTYSIDDQTPLNGANIKVKLLAQSDL